MSWCCSSVTGDRDAAGADLKPVDDIPGWREYSRDMRGLVGGGENRTMATPEVVPAGYRVFSRRPCYRSRRWFLLYFFLAWLAIGSAGECRAVEGYADDESLFVSQVYLRILIVDLFVLNRAADGWLDIRCPSRA